MPFHYVKVSDHDNWDIIGFSQRNAIDAIVNPVNCVGVSGKGLALEFKVTYKDNQEAYEQYCKLGLLKIGELMMFDRGAPAMPRYVVNFPTKEHWRNKSKNSFIQDGLKSLSETIKTNRPRIYSIAIPALGCGNGGLDWVDVEIVIYESLKDASDKGVNVYLFEPKDYI